MPQKSMMIWNLEFHHLQPWAQVANSGMQKVFLHLGFTTQNPPLSMGT